MYGQVDNKWTALHIAIQDKNEDTVKALIEVGADLNVKDAEGKTPGKQGGPVTHTL